MLNNLCPSSSNELFLFEWNKAYLNKNKRKIVEKINSVFHVNFHTQKKADNLNYYDEVDHKLDCVLKSVDDNIDELIISDSVSLTEVKINLQKNHLMATLYVVKDNKKGRPSHLIVRERQNKFLIYVELFNFMSMTNKGYLNVSLKQNIIKKIQLLKQYIDNQILIEELTKKKGNLTPYQLKGGLQEEIDNMTKNRQNWRYRLNLRGLLYPYLYLEFNLKRPDKRRIIKVISNPSVTKDTNILA